MRADHLSIANQYGTRTIAFLRRQGAGPCLVWLGGFRSDMRATKAEALDTWAAQTGRNFLRFDYSGHGESSGEFADGTIGSWTDDALHAITRLAGPAPVLVGSSMGGWIALLVARLLQKKGDALGGLVLIAPAVDFTSTLMWDRLPQSVRDEIERNGQWLRPSDYAPEPYPITKKLIADGRTHHLFGRPIAPGCAVHILQGMQDPDVPWAHAMTLLEHLPAASTNVTLVKDGDHRLSRPQDLALLVRTVDMMASR